MYFSQHGIPNKLLEKARQENKDITHRIVIVDNSESTNDPRGLYFDADGSPHQGMVWQEICQTAQEVMELSTAWKTKTRCFLLNGINRTITHPSHLYCVVPRGTTPLITCVEECLHPLVETFDQDRIMLMIITDGIPSDGSCAELISRLETILTPRVTLVIRLCTDDKEILDYYDTVARTLSPGLVNIVANLRYEAHKANKINPHTVYTRGLHLIQTMGINLGPLDIASCEDNSHVWDPITNTFRPFIRQQKLSSWIPLLLLTVVITLPITDLFKGPWW